MGTLRADTITDGAGTGAPNFPNGLSNNGSTVYAPATSFVRLTGGAGHGSTNTAIRIFSTIQDNIGTAISYASSAASGNSFTINEDGIYGVQYIDGRVGAAESFGVSRNSAQLTSNIGTITAANIIIHNTSDGSGSVNSCSATFRASAGDVIRAHTGGTADRSTDQAVQFSITQIART